MTGSQTTTGRSDWLSCVVEFEEIRSFKLLDCFQYLSKQSNFSGSILFTMLIRAVAQPGEVQRGICTPRAKTAMHQIEWSFYFLYAKVFKNQSFLDKYVELHPPRQISGYATDPEDVCFQLQTKLGHKSGIFRALGPLFCLFLLKIRV